MDVPGGAGRAVPFDDLGGRTALRGGFADLGPGTLALINLELLRQLPPRPALPQAIEALGRVGVAAIAVRGRVESNLLPVGCRLAWWWSCVLLQLPDSKEGGFRSSKRMSIPVCRAGALPYRAGCETCSQRELIHEMSISPVVDRS
jgi:hypothetical protein